MTKRLEEIRERLEDGVTYNSDAKSDIEWLLKQLDMLEDSMVVYKLVRTADRGVEVNSTLDVVSKGEGTGTSRYDWYGEDA